MNVVVIDKYKHRYTVVWGIMIAASMFVMIMVWLSVRPADITGIENVVTGIDLVVTIVSVLLALTAFFAIKPASLTTLWASPLSKSLSFLSKFDSSHLTYDERLNKFRYGSKNDFVTLSPEIRVTTVVKSLTLVIEQSNIVLYVPTDSLHIGVWRDANG